MSIEELVEAVRKEKSPCFSCYNVSVCLHCKLACSDYINYLNETIPTKLSRRPSRKLYNDVFPDFVGYSVERHGE